MESFKIFTYGDIPYKVYNNGKVVNAITNKTITPFLSNTGYLRVGLGKAKYRKNFSIHRLVANLFVDNPNQYDTVDHIDCNKQNNYYTNLRWVTQLDNTRLAHKNGLVDYNKIRGENNSNAKLNTETVSEIRRLYNQGEKICNISLIIFGDKNKK